MLNRLAEKIAAKLRGGAVANVGVDVGTDARGRGDNGEPSRERRNGTGEQQGGEDAGCEPPAEPRPVARRLVSPWDTGSWRPRDPQLPRFASNFEFLKLTTLEAALRSFG